MNRFWPVIVPCILAIAPLYSSLAADSAPDAAQLLKKLTADDFDERATAERQLEAIGEAARPVLELALKHDDSDVREAAQRLLGKLNRATLVIAAADRDGKPAAGAEGELTLYSLQGQVLAGVGPAPAAPQRVIIKQDGKFTLSDQTCGGTSLNVMWKKWFPAPGQMNLPLTRLNSGNNGIFYTLTRGGTVSGKILDADGKPLKEAKLIVTGDSSGSPRNLEFSDYLHANDAGADVAFEQQSFSGESDADGAVKVEPVEDGVYHCYATCSGYSAAGTTDIRVREGQVINVPEIRLKPKTVGKLTAALLLENGKEAKSRSIIVSLDPIFEGPDAAARQARFAAAKANMMSFVQGTTDEDGKYSVENVLQGKYTLRIRMMPGDEIDDGDATEFSELSEYVAEVTVAGEETKIGALKPAAGVAVSGRILDAEGHGLDKTVVGLVPESELIAKGRIPGVAELLEGSDLSDRKQQQAQQELDTGYFGISETATKSGGKFAFKRVQPGRYVMACQTNSGATALVFDVEVKAGAALTIPEVKLDQAAQKPGAKAIKGIVLLDDNKPAANGQVMLYLKSGASMGNGCDNLGNFSIDNVGGFSGDMSPVRLVARFPGYKSRSVDLNDPKVTLNHVEIRLEKQKYGKIEAKVVDPEGHPVAGATVTARVKRSTNPLDPFSGPADPATNAAAPARTDKSGTLVLDKQPEGSRTLQVQAPGYYDRGETVVAVSAEKTSTVSITVRPGLVVSGKVELPPDSKADPVVILIGKQSGFAWQSAIARADGSFAFSGFEPGTYVVNVMAPGLIAENTQKAVLKEGQAAPTSITVKMIKPGASVLCVDPALTGRRVELTTRDIWKNFETPSANPVDDDATVATISGSDRVDASGRAELFGAPPGNCDAVILADERVIESDPSKVDPVYVIPGVAVQPVKSVGDLVTTAAAQTQCKPGTGKLTGVIHCDPPKESVPNGIYGSLHARIVSQNCYADWYSANSQQLFQPRPLIVGKPPAELKNSDPGSFSISNLPAGEYQLYAEFKWYGAYGLNDPEKTEEKAVEKVKPLMTFSVKDGETLDLKEIKINIPAPDKKLLERAAEMEDPEEDMPQAPEFRP
jgi:uncharacterized GH25 family protein